MRGVIKDATLELTIGRRIVMNRGIVLPFHDIADDATRESSTKYDEIKHPGGRIIPLQWRKQASFLGR